MTSLVTKAAELGAVGTLTGVAMSGLAQVCLLLTIATSYSHCQTGIVPCISPGMSMLMKQTTCTKFGLALLEDCRRGS